jgi:hypothetical protein
MKSFRLLSDEYKIFTHQGSSFLAIALSIRQSLA